MSAAVMLFGVRTKERDKREEVILWPGNTHICLLWSVVGWVINSFHPGYYVTVRNVSRYKKLPCEARGALDGPKTNVNEPEEVCSLDLWSHFTITTVSR